MKKLVFHELLLVSKVEKASRRIRFHKEVTVLKGENDFGKSCVMKSIYAALGADPPNVHPTWTAAKVVLSLRFSIDGIAFRIIRQQRRFSLFDENDELIDVFESITKELAPYLATLFGFHLTLHSRGDDTQATPAFLYLPFYIDQDQGWQNSLKSFDRLSQFSNWRGDLVNFHAGIRPSEFYLAKSELRQLNDARSELQREQRSIEKVLDGIRLRLRAVDFDVDINAFKKEIEQLLERCSDLQRTEYKLRARMTEAYNKKQAINDQIEIVTEALNELREDRAFATDLEGSTVVCPTCHATYENGFAERFSIALDEDNCIQLLSELKEQFGDSRTKWENLRSQTLEAEKSRSELEKLLSVRRKKVKLRDVLRREGQKDVSLTLEGEIEELDAKIGKLDRLIERQENELNDIEDAKRKRDIKKAYKKTFLRLLDSLDVDGVPDNVAGRLDAQIKETGSDLPRGILAYYLALTNTIEQHGTSTLCPLVIDSPRQQDQDDFNWETILEVIRDERPGTQLILALVDDLDVDFAGKIINLKSKRKVLRQTGFESAIEELRPLLDASIRGQ